MKKVLFGLVALSSLALANETNLYFRVGADLAGKYDVVKYEGDKLHKEEADKFSYEFAIEATKEIYPNLEAGVGIAYQKHGDPKKYKDSYVDEWDWHCTEELEMPGYTSIPLYLTTKYKFNAINNFVPYVKANLGYSFNDEDGDFKLKYSEYDINNPTDAYADGINGKVKVENGLYYGLGAGFEYNNFTMDLMYQVTEAKAKVIVPEIDARTKKDYDYSRVTLSFGYKFNF